MIRVALDALGGDFAPDVVVEGAVNAVNKNPNVHVAPRPWSRRSLQSLAMRVMESLSSMPPIRWLWMNTLFRFSRRSPILAW